MGGMLVTSESLKKKVVRRDIRRLESNTDFNETSVSTPSAPVLDAIQVTI